MEEMWKNSAIIAKRNVDDNQNPISVQLYELKPVIDVHSCIVLNQLPDEFHGIEIEGFTQVYDIDKISTKNFKVDYANGVLYFHPNNIGKMLTINYYGIGCTLLSASRIYTKYDKYGNVLETLEEFIEKAKLYIEAIESLGGAVEVINELKENVKTGIVLNEDLEENIEVGTPLDASLKVNIDKGGTLLPKLVEANATATQKKIDLDKSIKNATDTNETLTNTNQSGVQTNLTLQQTIATGKDSIDKINATGNKSLIVGASEFANNEYTWTHNMNSEELHITMYDANTKEPLMLDCKPLDKNRILIKNSVEHPNIKVVLSASYYQGNALFGTNVEEFAGESIATGGKKVRLKDGNGVVENPITDSDAVFMADGKTKLTKKMNDVDASLADRSNLTNKKLAIMNTKEETNFLIDFANFAGQGLADLSKVPIGIRLHNYTDGTQMQIDNVGDGNSIIMRQSNNPSRRPDKPANYVGNGGFIQLQRAKDDGTGAMKSTEYLFEITKDADFLWRKNRTASITTAKATDNNYAFVIQSQFEHEKILSLNYKINTPLIEIKKMNDMANIISGASLSKGLNIQSIAGDINITSASRILVSENGITSRLLTAQKGANFPTTDLYDGKFFKSTYTGKYYLYNATTGKWELITTTEV